MHKIIAFSGSHGVGKTSLFTKIKDSHEGEKLKFFKEFNTGLYNIGFSLNGNGYDFNEVMFSQNVAFHLAYETLNYYLNKENYPYKLVFDRTCVDTYLYTKFFLKRNSNWAEEFQHIERDLYKKSKEILKHENIYHMLCPPFKDFDDRDRMNIEERDEIWFMFLEFFCENCPAKNYKVLEGATTAERYEEFNGFINTKSKLLLSFA